MKLQHSFQHAYQLNCQILLFHYTVIDKVLDRYWRLIVVLI